MSAVVPNGVPLGALASALAADGDGVIKREWLAMFDNAHHDARRRLYEPLPPQDHEIAAALADGARECAEVIDAVWNVLHP